jgi:hypothetical protein
MKGQYFALGLLSSVLLPIAADAQVVDRSLFAFGDAHTGPNVTATQIGNVTTIRSVNTPVTYNFANGVQVPGGTSAIYNLTATSVGAATSLSPGIFEQDYTGSFSITGLDDSNVLSGTFSEPLLGFDAAHSGSDNENQLQFSNFGNEGGWSFTSDISGLASNLNEDDQQIYFLGFFNASTLGITDGTYSSFTANGTGNFSSTGPAMATPEPSTYAMMLIGFVGLGYAGLRKARATAAFV